MIRINQLKLPIHHEEENLKLAVCKLLHIKEKELLKIQILKRSIDARKSEDIKYIYAVDVKVLEEEKILKLMKSPEVMKSPTVEYQYTISGDKPSQHRPVIIGSGPAGLFCAYFLAKNGYQPIIIERGEQVDSRIKTIEGFWQGDMLNLESNVQFGEGGAGTFSDGKLNTMVKDIYGRVREVLQIFIKYGAPSDILYLNKPHIGTDYLRNIIKNMRNDIISLGGEFRFETKLTEIIVNRDNVNQRNGISLSGSGSMEIINQELQKSPPIKENIALESDRRIEAIKLYHNGKEEILPCDLLILAIGHSARDTFTMLYEKGLLMEEKAFAVGLRIEHEQEFINKAQYKSAYDKLPPADYKLTYQCKNGRSVYSFCMCPGGFVVNASSEEKCLCVNGMSNYKRDEKNANSALIVTVTPDDFKKEIYEYHKEIHGYQKQIDEHQNQEFPFDQRNIFAGIEFQRKYEQLAYQTGQGKIPVQLYGDLLRNKESVTIGHIKPNIKGSYQLANLRKCLPDYVIDSILEGMNAFDHMIHGFAEEEAVFAGVEMRTSSPIRILRNKELLSNIGGIYPCGEGAGYAGGITSAAIDGIKIFEAISKKYKPIG